MKFDAVGCLLNNSFPFCYCRQSVGSWAGWVWPGWPLPRGGLWVLHKGWGCTGILGCLGTPTCSPNVQQQHHNQCQEGGWGLQHLQASRWGPVAIPSPQALTSKTVREPWECPLLAKMVPGEVLTFCHQRLERWLDRNKCPPLPIPIRTWSSSRKGRWSLRWESTILPGHVPTE